MDFWTFFAFLGIVVFLYYICFILILFISDCDTTTFLKEKFGTSIDVLQGKVIWITGASSGIGEHLALRCAKIGSKIILSARRREELERVKEQCLSLSAGKLNDDDVLVLPMDITVTENHQDLFDQVIEHFGVLDILVNNAGRSQRAIWQDIELDVDKSMFQLNVFGLIHLSRICVKYFLEKGAGHIAVTSSGAGIMGVPFSGSYTATKHALHGYFNALRSENLLNNLTITMFCPGPTFSNFLENSYTEKLNEKFGQTVKSDDKRMTGERCAELFAVVLANKIDESWVAVFPVLVIYYLFCYYPNILKRLFMILGPNAFTKIRDSRNTIKTK